MAKRGLFIAPFDELVDPRRMAELAAQAEARGWDGLFVWDHVAYRAPVQAVADPWVVLSAVAAATRTLRIGPMVTPLSRRRVQKLARETVSLDLLSEGRLTLGVGLGSDRNGELEAFGEVTDPRERARLLDTGLERLTAYWDGELLPRPVQRPRIPIWVAARYPNRRPLARAARFDGVFPIDLPGPDALTEVIEHIAVQRDGSDPFDVVVDIAPGDDPEPWEAEGATWVLADFGRQPREAEIRAVIDSGPR